MRVKSLNAVAQLQFSLQVERSHVESYDMLAAIFSCFLISWGSFSLVNKPPYVYVSYTTTTKKYIAVIIMIITTIIIIINIIILVIYSKKVMGIMIIIVIIILPKFLLLYDTKRRESVRNLCTVLFRSISLHQKRYIILSISL